ncbi:uncharacterized protein BJ212DRAFT_1374114 [Suillus subaureus]|uniref:Uncharacterized protein n=1 Tax=Suillus subaureus TaxID=48587 RepID=A0A9P7JAQ7_9AGAM|nr:uncharacterized protein BJ212DRAFT_1374114 [Suillus subaureus]KAG1811386.1 hypothetical protein BJ212DRAFT_1374114 [Suillus subaureus]
MFCLRTLRELKLLKFLSEAGVRENIISILDIIKLPSLDTFKEVCRAYRIHYSIFRLSEPARTSCSTF